MCFRLIYKKSKAQDGERGETKTSPSLQRRRGCGEAQGSHTCISTYNTRVASREPRCVCIQIRCAKGAVLTPYKKEIRLASQSAPTGHADAYNKSPPRTQPLVTQAPKHDSKPCHPTSRHPVGWVEESPLLTDRPCLPNRAAPAAAATHSRRGWPDAARGGRN